MLMDKGFKGDETVATSLTAHPVAAEIATLMRRVAFPAFVGGNARPALFAAWGLGLRIVTEALKRC
jgi:hypothetical protein